MKNDRMTLKVSTATRNA